mgnify:CR=1 FL=1
MRSHIKVIIAVMFFVLTVVMLYDAYAANPQQNFVDNVRERMGANSSEMFFSEIRQLWVWLKIPILAVVLIVLIYLLVKALTKKEAPSQTPLRSNKVTSTIGMENVSSNRETCGSCFE